MENQEKFCSNRQLQSLLGSLLYVSKCVKPAHMFLNRILMLLKENFDQQTIFLTRDFFKDLNWFHTFLTQFNGVVYYDTKPIQAELHLDASLTGMGEFLIINAMHFLFLFHLKIIHILLALKIWAYEWNVTVTGKHGSNYRLSLSCNRKSKKLNLTNLFNSQQ